MRLDESGIPKPESGPGPSVIKRKQDLALRDSAGTAYANKKSLSSPKNPFQTVRSCFNI